MSATRGTLAEALDMIYLQLAADSDEVVLPRDAAAQVGHGVIRAAMQAHPRRATFTVNAS